jgi:hypothetical protein
MEHFEVSMTLSGKTTFTKTAFAGYNVRRLRLKLKVMPAYT